MSSPTGAVLDGLDPQLQAIREKMYRGQALTKAESARWAQRLAAEKETLRTGGQVKETAVPQTPPAAKITPEQAGFRDQRQAQGYIAGREKAMKPDQPQLAGTVPGQRQARDSMVMGDAPDAAKTFDNGVGPHRGQDGLPAMWNVPKQVAGRYNGGNMNEGAGLPDGTIAMMGADGQWKTWKGGNFGPERYGSLAEVGQPPKAAAPVQPNPQADAVARAAMPRSSKAVGMPPDQPLPTAAAPVADMQSPADPMQHAAAAWAGQGGMMPRATPAAQPQPMIAPPPAQPPQQNPSIASAAAAWQGMGGMLPVAGSGVPTPPPAPRIAAPAPVVTVNENDPLASDPAAAPERPNGRNGKITGRASSSAPMFPNSIFNAGIVPQAPAVTISKPRPYQVPDTYNPFDSTSEEEKRRRQLAILPE